MMSKNQSEARTYSRYFPLIPVEGRGVRIRDKTGRWLIDCLAGAGAASLGWSHPVIESALRSVIASGAPLTTLDLPTPWRDRFEEELLQSLPPQFAYDAVIHHCAPSGANAVEAALMVAEIATGNHEHVAIEGGYHGCSKGARSVSSGGGLRRHTKLTGTSCHFLPFPQEYRCPFGVGGEQGIKLAIRAAERLLLDPHSPLTNPASILVECVLGEGGSLPAPQTWLQALRDYSLQARIPMIDDEIQAGMCRTGTMWAFEHSGVMPDIIVMSKGLGGGVPIAVIVIRSDLNKWLPGAFTGTFRGSTFAFAAAAAVLSFAREERLAARVTQLGERLKHGLEQVQRLTLSLGEVRGRGLMFGAEIIDVDAQPDRRGIYPPAPQSARSIQRACFERGLIVEVGGAYDNVVRFLPPLIIEAEEIDQVCEIFHDAVRRVEQTSQDRVLV
jgi:diaminobutyrate-2-oxoglutarate transaminase